MTARNKKYLSEFLPVPTASITGKSTFNFRLEGEGRILRVTSRRNNREQCDLAVCRLLRTTPRLAVIISLLSDVFSRAEIAVIPVPPYCVISRIAAGNVSS